MVSNSSRELRRSSRKRYNESEDDEDEDDNDDDDDYSDYRVSSTRQRLVLLLVLSFCILSFGYVCSVSISFSFWGQ